MILANYAKDLNNQLQFCIVPCPKRDRAANIFKVKFRSCNFLENMNKQPFGKIIHNYT